MIYGYSIRENSNGEVLPDRVVCAGVVSAKSGKQAEQIVRNDRNITIGYFEYRLIKDSNSRQHIYLYTR